MRVKLGNDLRSIGDIYVKQGQQLRSVSMGLIKTGNDLRIFYQRQQQGWVYTQGRPIAVSGRFIRLLGQK